MSSKGGILSAVNGFMPAHDAGYGPRHGTAGILDPADALRKPYGYRSVTCNVAHMPSAADVNKAAAAIESTRLAATAAAQTLGEGGENVAQSTHNNCDIRAEAGDIPNDTQEPKSISISKPAGPLQKADESSKSGFAPGSFEDSHYADALELVAAAVDDIVTANGGLQGLGTGEVWKCTVSVSSWNFVTQWLPRSWQGLI